MSQPDELSNEDMFQFLMLVHSVFIGFQRSYFLSAAGTLDIALRDSIGTAVHSVNHLPGIHSYWRQRKHFFQPEFITWVEELLTREPPKERGPYRPTTPTDPELAS